MGDIKFSQNMRLSGDLKMYHLSQLQIFANHFASTQVKSVHFGKQDTRGNPSITIVDHNHCVPTQRHFSSNKELLEYVIGYNMALSEFNSFAPYLKGAK